MHSEEKNWTLVIKPKSNLFDLHLADLWHYRDLVGLLVRRDFVSFYKQTIFGPLWFFIQPVFTTIIFVFVFGNLAGLSTDGLPGPLFYMANIVAWNYFSDCINKTSTVFKDNAAIFGKVYFPRLIMPISIVISNLVRFGVQFMLLILMMIYYAVFKGYHFNVTAYVLLYPFMIALLAALALGGGMIISAMTTKYRDLSFLITFGVQLFMYVTPVIMPLSALASKYKQFVVLNPLSPIFEGMRLGLFGKGELSLWSFSYSVIVVVAVLLVGIFIFNKVEKTFVDTV